METTMYQLTDGETAAAAVGGILGIGVGVILMLVLVFWIFYINFTVYIRFKITF